MARIIVTTDLPPGRSRVLYQERVQPDHLISPHFAAQLGERLAWAVTDAARAEDQPAQSGWTSSEP